MGAGVSGLSLGWRLASSGVPVEILEAGPFVGGLAGTVREDGYCLDFGPHSFFSEDPRISKTVLDLFDPPLIPAGRSVKFYYGGRYLDYPITGTSLLFQMGWGSGIRAFGSFLKGRLGAPRRLVRSPLTGAGPPGRNGGDEQSLEDWAIESFGEYLYRTFFKPYTEQFWLIPARELSARAIPTHTRLSFARTLALLVRRGVTKGGASLVERERLPAVYPGTGYGEIAERIAQKVRQAGGRIHLNSRAAEVRRLPQGGFRVRHALEERGPQIEGSHVVSTIPLPALIRMLHPAPSPHVFSAADRIDYRPLIFLGMATQRQEVLRASYVYLLDRPYNRITEMNKFSARTSPPGENIVAVEIPALRESPLWRASKEELFDRCIGSLEEDGILHREEVKRLFLVKAPYAYPIYRKGYAGHLQVLIDDLKSRPGLHTLGRSGEFMYMDADQCIQRAFDLADRLLSAGFKTAV
ncbi:MAG: FAD-dependent oxidoreductase [Candidatus Omnitrophica bacterium]|nr:FAD-dependent oxidoreductase [Candidatus Omnitrophota bacterium]